MPWFLLLGEGGREPAREEAPPMLVDLGPVAVPTIIAKYLRPTPNPYEDR